MALKDIAEKQQSSETSEKNVDEIEKLKQSVAVDSAIQGSFYFISGCVHTFMRLKGYDEIPPDELFKQLKGMNGLDKEELQNSEDPLHKFLLFYFYDES